jgi:hypothetical protein
MLRRLKSEVDFFIPKKREFVLYCAPQPTQKALYDLMIRRDVKLYVVLSFFLFGFVLFAFCRWSVFFFSCSYILG